MSDVLRPVTEDQFRRAVQDYATLRGWLVHHQRPAMRRSGHWSSAIEGDPGFPDCVFVRSGVVLFVEFKSGKGRATDGQRDWLAAISACTPGDVDGRFRHFAAEGNLMAAVWRPTDWDEIEKILH